MSLIRFLGHALAHGIAGEFEKAKLRKIELQKNTICCADCETDLAEGSRVCHSCGSARLCSQYDIEVAKADAKAQAKTNAQMNAAARMQENMIAAQEKQKDREFEERKKTLYSGMVCPKCSLLYESTHRFCPTCASQTEKVEAEVAEKFLRREFPERYNQ
ncbi:MAG: hypothetical protein NTW21_19870 [Verrucomicrobia bacterium]|nr:hypothetical protein [Verrucomicrobiota bacterium]